MKQTYDFKFLLNYSDRFVERAITTIFEQNQYLKGTELKTCTPVKQVNFFVIKYVRENWQAVMQQLEHPYFDYTSAEVQKARSEFMRILSHHIQIEQKYFKVLLKKATMDTLTLMFYPDLFFKTFTARYNETVKVKQEVLPLLKHINIHLSVVNTFKSTIEAEQEVSKSFLEKALKTALQNAELDNLKPHIASFNGVVELESLDTSETKQAEIEKEQTQISNLIREVKQARLPEQDNFEQDLSLEETENEQDNNILDSEPNREDKKTTLIERFKDEQESPKPTLHEQFQSQGQEADNTVLARLQKQQKKPNFLSTISIIDRNRFEKLLFNQNRPDYEEVMKKLNESTDYQEVMDNFQRYFRDYDWSLTDEATKDLLAYINNYF